MCLGGECDATYNQYYVGEVVRDALRRLEESTGPEWLLEQLIEGEQGEAKAWDDEALMDHVKQEAIRRGNL